MAHSGPPPAVATGYRLTLPGGWARITTGDGAAESIARYLDVELRTLSGRDRVLAERELGERMRRAVASAEERGALDIYLYKQPMGDRVFTMRFSVSAVFLGASAVQLTDAELASVLAADAVESAVGTLDGARAIRAVERRRRLLREFRADVERQLEEEIDPVALAEELPEGGLARRGAAAIAQLEAEGQSIDEVRVSHFAEVPDSHGAYLLIQHDLVETEIAPLQIELVDAIASTLRWVR